MLHSQARINIGDKSFSWHLVGRFEDNLLYAMYPHISIKATSKSVHLFPLEGPSCSLTHQVACLRVIHPRWPRYAQFLTQKAHSFLVMGLKMSSHDKTRCHLIKLRHDLLSLCHSCYWKTNRRFIFDWLMSCPKCNLVLNYVGSPRRFSSQNCKMGNALSIGIGLRIRLWHSSQRMVYYSKYVTKRKDVVLGVSLLRLVTSEP
jgi:hypothetical protein